MIWAICIVWVLCLTLCSYTMFKIGQNVVIRFACSWGIKQNDSSASVIVAFVRAWGDRKKDK